MRRAPVILAVLLSLLAVAGCATHATTVPVSTRQATVTTPAASPAASRPSRQPVAATPTVAPPTAPGIVWHPVGTTVSGVPATYLATTRAGTVALLWMDPQLLSFRYIPGTQYPERGPVLPADRQASTWVPSIAAAFNGAFKLRDHVGGYYYAGTTVSALRPGLASLVIDDTGRLSVVRWGREVGSVADLRVVRQNMSLLVDGFVGQATSHDANNRWGWADHDARLANRSALGELADDSLVYAFGHDVTALDMADALVQVRARTAIMLDMNKAQPMGYVYSHRDGQVTGQRVLASVYHDPSVYLRAGYYKDFVVALVRS